MGLQTQDVGGGKPSHFCAQTVPPETGQGYIRQVDSLGKQRGNLGITKPCDTTTDARHEETGVGMLLGTYSPFCTKLVHSRACCATAMIPLQIAAENEYLGT